MLYFENDYTEGAHPKVMEALVNSNNDKCSGYGFDEYCASATKKIKEAIGKDDSDVYFLVGGTQTNRIVIDTMLAKYEAVVAVKTGHVNIHEAGAIEASGHKVIALEEHQGKMNPNELDDFLDTFFNDANHDHMAFPGMVYISHPTEYGTLYTKKELETISNICTKYDIPLYLDGARLGYGIASKQTDVTLQDVANYCDVFYIGGTKVGALCGEAVVFKKGRMPRQFATLVKQNGAMLAKGRLLGVQFDALFTDNLYENISKNAIEMAELLKKGLHEKNIQFYLESETNQQFLIFENSKLEQLKDQVKYSFWEKYDDNHTVIRFATSWATTKEDVDNLISIL